MTGAIYTIHRLAGEPRYGETEGTCRITGRKGKGMLFENWVKDTFNDHDRLFPGNIISNEAMFCFDESSEIIQNKTGRDKPQRFRTYSHIVKDGVWYCMTKADKRLIFSLITEGAEMVCLTDTGQKHVLFKHKDGMWQLDELHIRPDIELLKHLHFNMCELMAYQFSQAEIISGDYSSGRIMKAGLKNWQHHESEIKKHRGSGIFDFTSFMLYTDENNIQEKGKSENKTQTTLW